MRTLSVSSPLACSLALFSTLVAGASAQNRIAGQVVDESRRVPMRNTVVPRARQAQDLGKTPSETAVQSLTVRFSMTPAQSLALDQLLRDQQNPRSPRFHQWLTPEQYAAQFGLGSSDLATVVRWLGSHGLKVTGVSRGRSFVTVAGSAGQVEQAFGVSLHNLMLNGEQHFANLSDPQLPASIAGVVNGITGLNDFHLKARIHARTVPGPKPDFTSSISGNHFVAPGDFYTIYDVNPLLGNGVTGAGVTIAVMGQTDISLADVAAFRSASGLSANAPTVKLYGTTDPGTRSGDIDEAQLDVEWSGAIAPAASILFVNSTDVIGGSLTQAIDNNVAPIITISYGNCESGFGASDMTVYNQLFRQANAQGQTIVGPAGDSGATDCDYQATTAVNGLAIDFPASSPYVTAMGGTMFNEGAGSYWSTTNNGNGGSALSYIPEAVWNESSSVTGFASGGGGVSTFFTKPSWQVGLGVPSDFSRDVPDLSFDAAASHDGYLFCSQGSCTNGYRNPGNGLNVVGGTSIATPSFAGVLALLEQKINTRIGNANPIIYGLANSAFSTAVFHDITVGNNASPCTSGTPNCPNGGSIGYNAGVGYDLATGWGTIDVFNLVNDWLLVTPAGLMTTTGTNVSATTVAITGSNAVTAGATVKLTATVVSGTSGITATPTGTVQLLIDNVVTGSSVPLASGTAALSFTTAGLSSGAHAVSVAYSGDTTYSGSKGLATIDIISATSADFTLTPNSATTTTTSGGTAPGVTFTITPVNGFTGSVAMSAANGPSSSVAATYSFSVTPVVITTATGVSTVFTLEAFQTNAITAPGQLAVKVPPAARASGGWLFAGSGIAMAGLLLFTVPRRKTRWSVLAAALLSISLIGFSGCSSGTAFAPPVTTKAAPGTYNITVTASATNAAGTAVTHNANVTFIVQ